MPSYEEREITEQVELCRRGGTLNPDAVGWTRRPLHTCNLEGRWPRKKKWNFWIIQSETLAFCIAIADVDYAGLAFGFLLDYETLEEYEQTEIIPFGIGFRMPYGVEETVAYENRKISISLEYGPGGLRIKAGSPDFGGKKMEADIRVEIPPDHERLGVVIPWSEREFQYTSKHNTLPAEGRVALGDRTYNFSPEDSFAHLDFGRGVWPRRIDWNWAAASGRRSEGLVGLQFGGLWTDGTGMNECAVCLDGRLSKISEDVIFSFNKENYMEQWELRSSESDDVRLTVSPFYEKKNMMNLLIGYQEVHQVFGRFNGTVVHEGRELKIDNIVGWSEFVQLLW